MKKLKPSIDLSSKIKNVVVIVKAEPYYESVDDSGLEKKMIASQKQFDSPRKFKMSFPLHINYDGYIYDNVNTINALIAQNINGLAGELKKKASEQFLEPFDGITFYILDISSEKEEEDSVIAEWKMP
jgi:hypothetical protein